ncbi:alkanesulfonate transporter substrate-binding subunit [Escherichia coli]|uniref:Alkanesulfonate transporter substrate-binding subunit n=1 Tax=Escherichia coli TaxID=562 RepID=A0A484WQT2_ECOLX|nr:alkanesulfonate transporter substrate-binding subunit [Escherichia coli]
MPAPRSSKVTLTPGLSGIPTTPLHYYRAACGVLKDGTDLNQTGSFYLAARPYAEKNGAFIQGVLTTFSEADALTRSQREQSIALLAKTMAYRHRLLPHIWIIVLPPPSNR